MSRKAAVTVQRPREEVRRFWESSDWPQYIDAADATVDFKDAPGDRGTEIYVDLQDGAPSGRLGEMAQRLVGAAVLPRVKDELRRFKQRVETGVIPRSEGSPEGESASRKFKQRPAQPLSESELQRVGA